MTPDDWKRVETLYFGALERPPESRAEFLDEACAHDQELRRQTEALLRADNVEDGFLSRSALQIAALDMARQPIHTLAGKRIAQYEILSPLGSGGMGEVYFAQDTRLGRKVAIKFLYPESPAEPGRHRLLKEAQAAAALDHPNICTVYEAGEAESFSFIVMQYVEGETLAARIQREPIDLSEALLIAEQVALALSAAHAQGVIHRDIKPQNILLTPRREVKVLDFGLATRLSEEPYDAVSAEASAERPMVAGTPGYTSPEQVRGAVVDRRTDLFSLGVVLYEMLTRRRAFSGGSTVETMTAIIETDPQPLSESTPGLPAEVEIFVRRLLAKEPSARWQTASEVENEVRRLRKLIEAVPETRAALRKRVAGIIGIAAMLAVAVWIVGRANRSTPPQTEYVQLTNFSDGAAAPILSPDGRLLAFIRGNSAFLSRGQIWIKELPDGQPLQLTNESMPISTPHFSPDGAYIAYTVTEPRRVAWDTWMVPVRGGPPQKLFSNATGLTWIDNQRILFSQVRTGMHMGVVTSSENRSDTRDIYFPAHERGMAHYSFLSPDRRSVLIVEMDHTAAFRSCRLVPYDGSSTGQLVGPEGTCTSAAWSLDGKWMYFAVRVNGESHLWRQRFPDGVPEQITFGPTEQSGIAVPSDGRSLVTAMGLHQGVVWIHDKNGDRPVSAEGNASRPMFNDTATKVYYLLRRGSATATNELWVTDLTSGTSAAVLSGFQIARYDISQDEKEVVVSIARGQPSLWVARIDGSAPPQKLPVAGDNPFFGPRGEVVFQGVEGRKNYLFKTTTDRSRHEKVVPQPISTVRSASADGEWVTVIGSTEEGNATHLAISVSRGYVVRICTGACIVQWSPNGRFFQVAFDPTEFPETGQTFVVPLAPGEMLPPAPPSGFRDGTDLARISGLRAIPAPGLIPGLDPETYAYVKTTISQNIYRITLP